MENKNTENFSIFTIAAAYIGTVVGAGFASGQEVLQFFDAYGWHGLIGIAVASLLFFFLGYSVLLIGRYRKAKSHMDIVYFTNGKVVGAAIDIIITAFLFLALSAMIAGAGAIFNEQFRIPAIWGAVIMALITMLTVITGIKGVIKVISYVVPFLILSVVFISLHSLFTNPLTSKDIETAKALSGATPNWFLSAVNYACYNTVISIAVLAPMGAKTAKRKNLFWGALAGALGLGVGITAIYLSVLTNISDVAQKEIPMILIASRISVIIKLLFATVLFAEVYTTAVGNLYGFVHRFSLKSSRLWLIFASSAIALIVSLLGFSNMVKYLYPAVGYGGILFLGGVIYVWFAKKSFRG